MIHARMMYLRPGNLFKEFQIVKVETGILNGVPKEMPVLTGDMVFGCLEEAKPEEKVRWGEPQHPITHSIVQAGFPKAEPGWFLKREEAAYRIHGIDTCGNLGIATIYYVEERRDCSA